MKKEYVTQVNTFDTIDEEIKKIIKNFCEEEKDLIIEIRNQDDYEYALNVFEKNKTVKRLCQIIKTLYTDLKNNTIPTNDNIHNDEEIATYEREIGVSKYVIVLAIDCLNTKMLQLNKISDGKKPPYNPDYNSSIPVEKEIEEKKEIDGISLPPITYDEVEKGRTR